MTHDGRCYCGAVRYEISAAPVFNAQCHWPFHHIPADLHSFERLPVG